MCDHIIGNQADKLRQLLTENKANIPIEALQLALRYAALLGDDMGMQVIGSAIYDMNGDIPNDVFDYAMQPTTYDGVGGHTLAALYAQKLAQSPGFAKTSLEEVKITSPKGWSELCSGGVQVQPLCACILRNDADALRRSIQQVWTGVYGIYV